MGFAEDDFATDFDPDQYDQRMSAVFGEEYYENDETEKPTFPSDEGMYNIAAGVGRFSGMIDSVEMREVKEFGYT